MLNSYLEDPFTIVELLLQCLPLCHDPSREELKDLHDSLETCQWSMEDHFIVTSLWLSDVSKVCSGTAVEEHLRGTYITMMHYYNYCSYIVTMPTVKPYFIIRAFND